MKTMSLKELRDFYVDHLFNVLVSFWLANGIDRGNGGYFTCFNNAGDRLVSTNKYTWSQGRFLWMVSRLAYAFGDYVDGAKHQEIQEAARIGAEFLKEHALLPNGNAAWALNERGEPILVDRLGNVRAPKPGEGYDLGIAADEFLVYGMGEFSRAAGGREFFDFTMRLFESVEERLRTGNYKSAPHYVPKGYKNHGKSMIMLETAQELASVAAYFGSPEAERLTELARQSLRTTQEIFVRPEERVLLEMVKQDNRTAYDEMLGSYVNPGHSLEDAWFMMHFAAAHGGRDALGTATDIVRWMIRLGWDEEYGGLPQFVHKDGGQPRGKILEANRDDHMILELTENWSNKLWWVHSEALYALILAYEHTSERAFLDDYWRMHEYAFGTFPNPDRKVGEWIQIRDRQGRPEEKVVALPVKDPYHVTRAFMHLIKSLERMIGEGRE